MLKEKYEILKHKLGKIPNILDFYEYGEVDPMLFVDYAKTYDRFVRMVDTDYAVIFNQGEEAALEFISSLLIGGKRPHELLILRMLMNGQEITENAFCKELECVGTIFREEDYHSAINVLRKDFINTQSEKKKYETVEFFDMDEVKKNHLRRASDFYIKLKEYNFKRELSNLLGYGLKKYNDLYKGNSEDSLVLYQKYSRKDVCRLLDWERDDSSTIYC